MLELPQGRLIVGRFGGVVPVSKKDGTIVPGMFDILVVQDLTDREWNHRATFFATDQEGETSRIQKNLDTAKPQEGDTVAVRISTRGSMSNGKAYANDTAVALTVLVSKAATAVKV